jgi:hypothetical protein
MVSAPEFVVRFHQAPQSYNNMLRDDHFVVAELGECRDISPCAASSVARAGRLLSFCEGYV